MIEQVRLGLSGLYVSQLGLGMMSVGDPSRRSWLLDETAAEPIFRRAIENGFTSFDTADMYADGASELVAGRLLRKLISREEAVIATKVFYPTTPGPNGRGLSRKHILAAIDASLERLGLDYVDLYQIHRFDSQTPIEETMEALHDVVRSGKARYLGACAVAAWQLAKAQAVAERGGWTRFVSVQSRHNLIDREAERELIPCCRDHGVAVLPYSPLARGLLAGTRAPDGSPLTERARSDPLQETIEQTGQSEVARRLAEVAQGRGLPEAQVALAWLLHKRAITAPIIGATRSSHIDDAIVAATLELSDDEIDALEELYVPQWSDHAPAAVVAEPPHVGQEHAQVVG